MRRRVEQNVPAKDADRQLKLGAGGLRDVEFTVQLLQLVHGRSDVMLHSATTLDALESLATWGYVGREDAERSRTSYAFLRTLEHRIQLHRLRRTHVVPGRADDDLRRIARSMGMRSDPVAELTAALRRHRREVRRLHEKLFYRPLLNAVARLDAGRGPAHPRGRPSAARGARLRRPGGGAAPPRGADLRRHAPRRDPAHAAAGDARLVRRRARPRRRPARLPSHERRARLDAVVPAAAARRVARRAAPRHACSPRAATPPTCCCARPRRVHDARRRRRARAAHAARRWCARRSPRPGATTTPRWPSPRCARCAGASCSAPPSPSCSAWPRSTTAAVALSAIAGGDGHRRARDRRCAPSRRERGRPLPTRMLVVAMGRFGGGELGFASDADVHVRARPAARRRRARRARGRARRRRRAAPAAHAARRPTPPLEVDADLRPEGRNGPLVRTLASYAAYYERWSSAWEAQALLRAEPVAGDTELGARVRRAHRPAALPRGRHRPRPRCARSGGSRRAWRPSGCRAAPTPGCTPSSVAAGSPTSSGSRSCCSCSTATRCPDCGRPARCPRSAAAVDAGLLEAGGRRAARRGVAHRHPGARRRHARDAARPATWCRPTRATSPRGLPGARVPAGGERGVAGRLPSDHASGASGGGEGVLRVTTDATRSTLARAAARRREGRRSPSASSGAWSSPR